MQTQKNADAIKSIIIVGGGTAGWLTAGILAARYAKLIDITLIESSDIPTIGVGEGSWPSLRNTLRDIGVSEIDFLRECDASFKQGVKFINWTSSTDDHHYYHPFSLPIGFLEKNIAPYWINSDRRSSFSNTVCAQEFLCEKNLAPKTYTTPDYKSHVNYGYHLDAGKFVGFLKKHCIHTLGMRHLVGTITKITQNETGIAGIYINEQELNADLFIDCTGFKSLLLGQTLGAKFIDKSQELFIDSAIAVQTPYVDDNSPIKPYTISEAKKAGWIWDIGLYSRKGIGHVYSSKHMSEDEAFSILEAYVGSNFHNLSTRKIQIPCGYRDQFWIKNCVAIGMSAGFIEPLEASAIVTIELAAAYLRDQLPYTKNTMHIVAKKFNELHSYRWNKIIDFLKLHYILSGRNTDFWNDNKDPMTISNSLRELLELWKYRVPYKRDLLHKEEIFPAASYQYILYGMGFMTKHGFEDLEVDRLICEKHFLENTKIKQSLASILPDTRSLLSYVRNCNN